MRNLLLFLVSFVTLTALIGGMLLIYEPGGALLDLSPSILDNSPFADFLIPGIALTFIVGGLNAFTLALASSGSPLSFRMAIAGGISLIGWIVLQMLFTQSYHWLQLLYLGLGLLIVLISYQLMGKAVF